MTDAAPPWERRPAETSRAYAAFRQYRDAGPGRALTSVAGHHYDTVRKWASRHRWKERAQAWDAEAYRQEDAARLEAVRAMDDTHARAGRALVAVALRAIGDVGDLTPHQAARFLDLGTRLERSALLGGPLAPNPPTPPTDDDDGLSPLERIARELAGA